MKVLIYSVMPVIPPDYGGAVRVFNVAQKLSEKGVGVIVVSPKPKSSIPRGEFPTYIFYRPFTSQIIEKIKFLSRIKYFLWFFLFFKELFLLIKIVKSETKEGLILQSESIYSVPPLYVLKKIYKCPLVITEHNIEAELSLEINRNKIYFKTLKFLEKKFLEGCDHIVCMSELDKRLLTTDYNILQERISVIPNSVNVCKSRDIDEEAKKIKRRFSIGDEHKVILFVGTLYYAPNKVALEIIKKEIAPRIKSRIPNVKFFIVGKGATPKTENNFIFTGGVKNIEPYIKICDVAICPLLQGGGTRLKILEYMAFGKPVVSTTKGVEGIDAINQEEIVITDDWDEFSDEIIQLINDRKKANIIGMRAKQLVETKFSWNKNIEKYIKIYEEFTSK